jgi:hypothetical protein
MKTITTAGIPRAVLAQHLAVLGKTGSGKSSVLRSLVEDLLRDSLPVCIIDPKGDWWGLKSSADGKKPGFPVIIFGGSHADVPINEHSGAQVGELVATGNRPCIIDFGGWEVAPRTRFFIEFASALFRHAQGQRWLVIDEVHNFAPQGKVLDPSAGKALHWANRLASEGRGKGVQLMVASQRPQKVHKDLLTSCETLVAMRVIHPLDRKAVKEWIDGCPDPGRGTEVLNSLAQMPRGTGWVWSPEIGFGPAKVAFPLFSTYDSFKPSIGAAVRLQGWAETNLDEVRTTLAEVVKEAEASDPKRLHAEIARLRRELTQAQRAQPAPAPPERVEVPVLSADDRAQLEKLTGTLAGLATDTRQFAADTAEAVNQVDGVLQRIRAKLDAAPQIRDENRKLHGLTHGVARPSPTPSRFSSSGVSKNVTPSDASKDLPEGERKILTAIAQYPNGVTRDQLTVLTGYKRSTRDAYLHRLRGKGFHEDAGAGLTITHEGIEALGDFEPLPIGAALLEYWLRELPGGERRLLEILAEAFPEAVDRDELTEASGFKRSTRDAYLHRMKRRMVVEDVGRGQVRASALLFDRARR